MMTKNAGKIGLSVLGSLIAAAALSACGGDSNSGGTKCSGLNEGDFIITEFMPNPAGTDDFKEYVEIYNPGAAPLTLDGLQLIVAKSDGSSSKSNWKIKGSDVVINPGEYFVIGDFDDKADENGVVPLPYQHLSYYFNKKLGLNNSNGMISFKCGSTVVDSVTYESSSEARAQILSGDKLNNPKDPTSWCAIPKEEIYDIREITSYTYNDDGSIKSTKPNYGAPKKANPVCKPEDTPEPPPACEAGPGQCCDDETGEARDIVPPDPGKLIITEIMAYAGDNVEQEDGSTKFVVNKNYQYVELYAKAAFDLQGVMLSKSASAKWALGGSDCMRVEPGQDFIVVKTSDSSQNGDLDGDKLVLSKLDMNQSGTLSILATRGSGESAQEVVIDSVDYPKTTANTSWQRSSDFSNNFCESTATYGNGFHGTPSAENSECPDVGPQCDTLAEGQCCDNGTPRSIRAPAVDDFVITEIMAYAGDAPGENGNEGETFKANKNYQFIEILSDESFDLNGLTVSKNATSGNWKIDSEACVSVPRNSYFVIAKNGDTSANGGIEPDYVLSKLDMNQSGTIQFIADRGGEHEAIIAQATYSKTTANTSWQLSSDESGESCESTESYGSKFHGTPGDENSECEAPPAAKCSSIQAGNLVITEVMANPSGTDKWQEWVEVYNTTSSNISLEGVTFTKSTQTDGTPKTFTFGAGAEVAGNGYFVFGDAESNSGFAPYMNYAFAGEFALPNSNGRLKLSCGETLLDVANYGSVTDSASVFVTSVSATANDSADNWCSISKDSSYQYTSYDKDGNAKTNYGTPGTGGGTCAP